MLLFLVFILMMTLFFYMISIQQGLQSWTVTQKPFLTIAEKKKGTTSIQLCFHDAFPRNLPQYRGPKAICNHCVEPCCVLWPDGGS